jgi:membrane protein
MGEDDRRDGTKDQRDGTKTSGPSPVAAWISSIVQEWNRRQFGMHASSVTYFYFLAIIPIFIFISVLLPFTDIGQNEIIQAIDAVVPDIVSDLLDMVVTEAFQHASALIPLSVVTLLWTSIQGNMALLRGMDSAYNEEETRPYWMRLLISFVWTTVLLMVFLTLMLLVFSGKIREFAETYLPGYHLPFRLLDFSAMRIVLSMIIAWLFIAATYWFMPNGKRRFQDQLLGAALVAVAWFVLSEVFSVYVNHVNKFTAFYGTLGTFAISLFWMYCFFYILLAGGFVNCFFEKEIGQLMDRIGSRGFWLVRRIRRKVQKEDR